MTLPETVNFIAVIVLGLVSGCRDRSVKDDQWLSIYSLNPTCERIVWVNGEPVAYLDRNPGFVSIKGCPLKNGGNQLNFRVVEELGFSVTTSIQPEAVVSIMGMREPVAIPLPKTADGHLECQFNLEITSQRTEHEVSSSEMRQMSEGCVDWTVALIKHVQSGNREAVEELFSEGGEQFLKQIDPMVGDDVAVVGANSQRDELTVTIGRRVILISPKIAVGSEGRRVLVEVAKGRMNLFIRSLAFWINEDGEVFVLADGASAKTSISRLGR